MSTRKHITGNTTADVDLKFGQSGKAWATVTVISNDGKDEKATKCVTRCKMFGELAENCAESLPAGTRVIIEGREQTEEWEKDGEKRSGNVLIVDSIGPDLRFATAKVSKTARTANPGVSAAQEPNPWASPPSGVPF